jgi:hypothetical protein
MNEIQNVAADLVIGNERVPPVAAIQRFDYASVAVGDAGQLRERAARIRTNIQKTTGVFIEIGHDLLDAKNRLDHGRLIDWIEAECGFSIRTAQNYMRAAELADKRGATVALLPPRAIYRLAAKATPPEVIEAVISRAKAGETVSDDAVKDLVDAANSRSRPTKRANRRRNDPERARSLQTPGELANYLRGRSATCLRLHTAIATLTDFPPAVEISRYLDEEPDRSVLIDEHLPRAILWLQELAIARRAVQHIREVAPRPVLIQGGGR